MYKSILSLLAIFQIMEKVQMLIKLHPSIEENLGTKKSKVKDFLASLSVQSK